MRIRSPRDLAVAVRGRRTDLGRTQADVAETAGVSRKWVYEFEGGKPTAEIGSLLRVLDALGLALEVSAGAEVDDRGAEPAGIVDLDHLVDEHRRP